MVRSAADGAFWLMRHVATEEEPQVPPPKNPEPRPPTSLTLCGEAGSWWQTTVESAVHTSSHMRDLAMALRGSARSR